MCSEHAPHFCIWCQCKSSESLLWFNGGDIDWRKFVSGMHINRHIFVLVIRLQTVYTSSTHLPFSRPSIHLHVVQNSVYMSMSADEQTTTELRQKHTTTYEYHGPRDSLVPLYGYPSSAFWAVHILAVITISISILCSVSVLIYLYKARNEKFWSRPIGERLVVYLATCDFLMSSSHLMDHTTIMILLQHPPYKLCAFFAFFLMTFFTVSEFSIIIIDRFV